MLSRRHAAPCCRSTPRCRSGRCRGAAPGWWTKTAPNGSTPTAATPWPPPATATRGWWRPSPSRRAGSSSTPRRCRTRCAPSWPTHLAARCPDPLGRVFFCNSGAEANENALHLARKATGRRKVVSVTGGWHGRTVATLACCDGRELRGGRPAGRHGALRARSPFNDVASLDAVLNDSMAAVIVEPVQGMAGARDCSRGIPRRGAAASAPSGASPCCSTKSSAASAARGPSRRRRCTAWCPTRSRSPRGSPPGIRSAPWSWARCWPRASASATSAAPSAAARWRAPPRSPPWRSSTTRTWPDNATTVGAHIAVGARALGARKVWGRGLLIGLDFDRPAAELQQALFGHRILTGTSADPNVLRIMPPLTLSVPEADVLLAGLGKVLA